MERLRLFSPLAEGKKPVGEPVDISSNAMVRVIRKLLISSLSIQAARQGVHIQWRSRKCKTRYNLKESMTIDKEEVKSKACCRASNEPRTEMGCR